MGWTSRLYLLSSNDTLHRLAGTAFTRMLGGSTGCRATDFARQRVRLAGATVELAGGIALGVRHMSFSMLDFDGRGALDVQRLNSQQVARLDTMLSKALTPSGPNAGVVHAASPFVTRGGRWKRDGPLRRRIRAAALGEARCPRVRIVG